MYVCMYTYMYMYIYIYVEREYRSWEFPTHGGPILGYLYGGAISIVSRDSERDPLYKTLLVQKAL